MEVPSISGSSSSKRARAPGSGSNMMSSNHVVAHCLVDGCNADLSLCRDYHRRHKVCEMHSKTAKVTIGGREQRFCQQCSRFHSLVEFDEGKRSCRKRLDGHNRRRRKPQQETLPRNSSVFNSNIFSTQQASVPAGTLVSFGSPQMLTTSSSSSSSWAGLVKPDNNNNDMLLYNHNHQKQLGYMESRNSFSEHNYNQFHLLRNSQSLVDHNAGSSGISHKIMFSDSGLNQVVDSDHALSLLSSAPPVTREFGLVQTQPAQPLPHNNMHYFGNLGQNDFFSQGGSKPPLVPATDSHGNDASTPHFPDMFQHGPPQGSPTSGSHQTLTFMWE